MASVAPPAPPTEIDLRPPCSECGCPVNVRYEQLPGEDIAPVTECTNVRCGARW